MSSAAAVVSIGDDGVLNTSIEPGLSEIWIDRDLSWLDFNERVLAEALDERTPLLERAKFLAIFSSNLDEFFMKRIAVLRERLTNERLALLGRLREKLLPSLRRQADCFHHSVMPGLKSHGIHLKRWEQLTFAQQEEASRYFDESISPALTPLVIDPSHPFPFLSNLSTSLACVLHDAARGETMFARVKVPNVLRQWVALSGTRQESKVLTPLHEVIRGNLAKLYAGMELSGITLFRLTRDAQVELEDDPDEEVRELVREQIRQRRYEPAVRLEFSPNADPAIRRMLGERFQLHDLDVYDLPPEGDYTALFEIAAMELPTLRDRPWTPLTPPALADARCDIFSVIRSQDLLVHHPYDSFDASVEHFVSSAADDPHTVAIKMTAYRIGDDTPFVRSLIRAAESGKQVACVIELMARFDEERNLHWAAELEAAGAHVTYGVRGFKTHAKVILVVRKEADELRAYVHIGTGNYHVRTARLYADVGLFTCVPALTRDVINLFHYLTGHSQPPEYHALLVAPAAMRARFLELIRREIENQRVGLPSRIVAKMNQLEDPSIIDALRDASRQGVSVDLIVRGLCCLRPGVPGATEGIRIRSIIGRFLEHSRIFHFAAAQNDPLLGNFYIGSADWMFRNLSCRIEVVTPVRDRVCREKLWEILSVCLRDQRQAWRLESGGTYTRMLPGETAAETESVGSHEALMNIARSRTNS